MAVTFDQVIQRLDGVREYSNYAAALCPWHADNTPSLLVYRDGFVICKACGHTDNLRGLWDRLQGGVAIVPRVEPTQWRPPPLSSDLGEQEGFLDEAHRVLLKYPALGWYLEQRGVLDRIDPLELGWHDGWYTVPIRNEAGQLMGMVMRAGQHIQEATGRRFHMPKQPPMMYVPDWTILRNSRVLFVVFGTFDAIVLNSLRLPVTTGIAGMGWLDVAWLQSLRYKIVFVPDAGEDQVARKYANQLDWRGRVHKLNYPEGCKDPADYAKLKIGKRDQLLNELSRYL